MKKSITNQINRESLWKQVGDIGLYVLLSLYPLFIIVCVGVIVWSLWLLVPIIKTVLSNSIGI